MRFNFLSISWVKVTVKKPVWYKVKGLREVLKPDDITE